MADDPIKTTEDDIEMLAIDLYDVDGFALALWTSTESWPRDREDVRERYRTRARAEMEAPKNV